MRMLSTFLVYVLISSSVQVMAQKPKVAKARKAMKAGDWSSAIYEINLALTVEQLNQDPENWWLKAQIYAGAEEEGLEVENALQETLAALNKTSELSNGDVSKFYTQNQYPVPFVDFIRHYWALYFNKGAEFYGYGDFDAALTAFEDAQLILPKDTNAYINAALAAHQMKDWSATKRNYAGAIAQGTKSKDIYSLYVSALNEEGSFEEIMELAVGGRKRFPLSTLFVGIIIDTWEKSGKAKVGTPEMVSLIEAEEDRALFHYIHGEMLEGAGDTLAARSAFNRALEIDPNEFNTNFNIGVNLINAATEVIKQQNDLIESDKQKAEELDPIIDQQLQEALPQWQKLNDLRSKNIRVLETLEYIYRQLKMFKEAKATQNRLARVKALR